MFVNLVPRSKQKKKNSAASSKRPVARVKGKGAYHPRMAGWRALGRGSFLGSIFDNISPVLSKTLHGVGSYDDGVSPFIGDVKSLDDADIISMKGSAQTMEMQPVIIERSEFLGVIESSTSYVNRKFEVNPGLDSTFPWASKVAPGFQQWTLDAMMVEYKSMTPSATAAFTSLGNVCIAAALDPSLPDFEDPSEISMAKFACCRKPDQSFKAPVECRDFANRRYFVRTGSVPPTGTLSAYDPCNVQIATYGQPAAGTQIGNVWIHYRIKLFNPVMRGFGEFIQTAHYTGSAPTDAAPFAGVMTCRCDNIGVLFPTTASISLPVGSKGKWRLEYSCHGTLSANPTSMPVIAYTSNCAADADFVNSDGKVAVNMAPNPGLGVVGIADVKYDLVFDVPQNTLPVTLGWSFAAGALPTGVVNADFFLTQLSDDTR